MQVMHSDSSFPGRRSLKQASNFDVIVETAQELREAVDGGALPIEIRAHLDLSPRDDKGDQSMMNKDETVASDFGQSIMVCSLLTQRASVILVMGISSQRAALILWSEPRKFTFQVVLILVTYW